MQPTAHPNDERCAILSSFNWSENRQAGHWFNCFDELRRALLTKR
jgi:hypothetical protein